MTKKREIIMPLAPYMNFHEVVEFETEEEFDEELKRLFSKYYDYIQNYNKEMESKKKD